ncbi:hypothetical protein [Microvirgula aerodenitrificans]|uniref:hypothetical protein n=1 Tax=Microvirgula aerodenitrificans TaxID=57480 RepID=UPI0028F12D59|nr:hypothetical protein [Microvirgula aerodenitrificans]
MSYGYFILSKTPSMILKSNRTYGGFSGLPKINNYYGYFRFHEGAAGIINRGESYSVLTDAGCGFLLKIQEEIGVGVFAYVLLRNRESELDRFQEIEFELNHGVKFDKLSLKNQSPIILNSPYFLTKDI